MYTFHWNKIFKNIPYILFNILYLFGHHATNMFLPFDVNMKQFCLSSIFNHMLKNLTFHYHVSDFGKPNSNLKTFYELRVCSLYFLSCFPITNNSFRYKYFKHLVANVIHLKIMACFIGKVDKIHILGTIYFHVFPVRNI
jgi:hypothetical protein